ncbi:pyridoxal phosphate-dependent aminotransferase [Agriterribacter sp.]|uniref:pyridoxal phosphate-dependent aminotransferase n=1 Tax=Agriterribacter sp. TaxID=2821509 RepID=UPI002C8F86B5|nr:aminotransferase class I/II-fold pyridoxal phosphate-dependent enzyme [Agriterribacter sp.]HTN08439.1 aminotransferase class I/II-fold pyridoxal phosphate-dependent enzyme [Agriterribacter sp.]
MISTAKRLEGIGEYYFSQKLRAIDELNRQGKQIINLGIGSPDMPPHPDVIKTLQEESAKPNVHAYQNYKGSPVLREAIAAWYKTWYNITLNADTEILPLIGSKEGIMHLCMTYINEGDDVYVPNPGYPTYRSAATLAGGNIVEYTLEEKNNWLPDLEALKKQIAGSQKRQSARLLFVNYPHMPTGQLPTASFFESLVAFAKANNVLIVHDNPYSFILNDNPASILSVPGAKEVAVELNSLSKSQNMAGWRVGMLCGAKERMDEVLRFKSNMDSGMFLPVQLAAAKALTLGQDWYSSINAMYRNRREKVFALLQLLNCSFSLQQAGMFVWAKIPAAYKDGYALSDEALYNAGIFITPGGIFGSAGNNYIRVSLCCTEQKIQESIERVKASLKGKK